MKQDFIIDCINEVLSKGIFIYLILNLVNGSLQIGNFNTYRTATDQALTKLNDFSEQLADVNVDLIEVREFFTFMDYESTFIDGETKIKNIESIEFKNVYFSYPSTNKQVLKNISFKINKGEKIAFIGENGSGKTTIMKLIMNVYYPTKGEILINDIPTTEINTNSLRDQISILLQDFNLFEESVKDNITFGLEENNETKIYSKIPFKDLKTRIKGLDEKLNTILGSWFGDGINFSKGQIQKLALSRIFYRDTDCILLDEPNSALDPRSEKFLFEYIDKEVNNKICVSTLHVFTNIDIMDRIIMFEEGKIVAEGSHKELYRKSEKYTEFYNLQEKEEPEGK
jgi:ABC-type multidrug transport system fused ATPase/permease subunit